MKQLMMHIGMVVVVLGLMTGCSFLEKATASKEFKTYCEWAPIAIAAIEEAAQKALLDPEKIKVGSALTEAASVLKTIQTQCVATTIPPVLPPQ